MRGSGSRWATVCRLDGELGGGGAVLGWVLTWPEQVRDLGGSL
jgi:hypothetical protein